MSNRPSNNTARGFFRLFCVISTCFIVSFSVIFSLPRPTKAAGSFEYLGHGSITTFGNAVGQQTVNVPDVNSGDLLIAQFSFTAEVESGFNRIPESTESVPAGWSLIGRNIGDSTANDNAEIWLYYRIADGTEGSGAIWEFDDDTIDGQAVIHRFSGEFDINPVTASNFTNETVDHASLASSGLDLPQSNEVVLMFGATFTYPGFSATAPEGFTELYDDESDSAITYTGAAMAVKQFNASGDTGSFTMTTQGIGGKYGSNVAAISLGVQANTPPTMTHDFYDVKYADSVTDMELNVWYPAGWDGQTAIPWVIYLHGHYSVAPLHDALDAVSLAQPAIDRGFVLVSATSANPSLGSWLNSTHLSEVKARAKNLYPGLEGYLPSLVGFSMGGGAVGVEMRDRPQEYSSFAASAGTFDLTNWTAADGWLTGAENRAYNSPAYYTSAFPQYYIGDVDLHGRKIMLAHGVNDSNVPNAISDELVSALPPSAIEAYYEPNYAHQDLLLTTYENELLTFFTNSAIRVTHTITSSVVVNGSISPIGDSQVNHGSNQQYVITPAQGYHVDDVKIDGISVGRVSSYNFSNIVEDHTIIAEFTIDPEVPPRTSIPSSTESSNNSLSIVEDNETSPSLTQSDDGNLYEEPEKDLPKSDDQGLLWYVAVGTASTVVVGSGVGIVAWRRLSWPR
ncbi:prolyl oligopeptidase family serine peptidase [Candidatus Saccharibacteria bacterium]|nr:prolyl oligopeptidase family serine peptidase [Candidatus Saccharibacteria bacterium]